MPLAKNEFYGDKPKRREAWLRTLPQEVRSATDLTEYLKEALTDNKISAAAEMLAVCIQNKVWEHIAIYDDDNPEIKTYQPMEWCRDVLRTEPGELMKIVASPLPRPEVGAAAAIELIRMVKEFEPKSFGILTNQHDPDNWRELIKVNERRYGSAWIKVMQALDTLYTSRGGSGLNKGVDAQLLEKVQNLRQEGLTYEAIAKQVGLGVTTVFQYINGDRTPRKEQDPQPKKPPTTHRERIRRKLEKYSNDPELCSEKGIDHELVELALRSFLDGKSAAACERSAGLAAALQPEVRLRCKQDPTSVASRIIELLKPEEARELAEEIISQLAAA